MTPAAGVAVAAAAAADDDDDALGRLQSSSGTGRTHVALAVSRAASV